MFARQSASSCRVPVGQNDAWCPLGQCTPKQRARLHGRADVVDSIVLGRDASKEGLKGVVVKVTAGLHADVAQNVEP